MQQSLNLRIGGMSCGHCVSAVKQALADVPTVKVENVSIGSAQLNFNPAETTEQAIADAVTDAGYEAEVVGNGDASR